MEPTKSVAKFIGVVFFVPNGGHTWDKSTANPEDVHGCPNPNCKWWFDSRENNGKWDHECIKYIEI